MINKDEKRLIYELNEIRFLDSHKKTDLEMQNEIEDKINRYENILVY